MKYGQDPAKREKRKTSGKTRSKSGLVVRMKEDTRVRTRRGVDCGRRGKEL